MIALFHSPVIGQAGCNSTAAAIACVATAKFKQKVLIIQLRDGTIPVEKLLFKKELDSITVKAEEDTFDDTGIDALFIRANSSILEESHFENCCIDTLSGNSNLKIVGVTKKTSIEAELDSNIKNIIELLKVADRLYQCVFVIAPKTDTKFTQTLLTTKELNLISVMCVPQNAMVFEKYYVKKGLSNILKKKEEENDSLFSKRTLLIVGNADADSKLSPRNIAVGYGYKQGKVCSILHDAHFKDALSQGDLFNFVIKNLENDIHDDIYSFSKHLIEATGKLLAQEPKDGQMIYTHPLPDKERYKNVAYNELKDKMSASLNINTKVDNTPFIPNASNEHLNIEDEDMCIDDYEE